MRYKKGITLIELLVVMAITLVLGAGLFSLYRTLTGRSVEMGSVMKNQAQLYFVIDNLAKTLSSAGFGIDKDNLDYGKVIKLANQSDLTILTRASTQEADTPGCWGIIDDKGEFKLKIGSQNDTEPISSTLKKSCPNDHRLYTIKLSVVDKSPNCNTNCLAFPNLPVIQVRVYLDNQNLSPVCLSGTKRLMLDMNGAGEIIQCVGDLRFRYLAKTSSGEIEARDYGNEPSYDNLVGIRLCMMVQLSEGVSEAREYQKPQYTEGCGGQGLTQVDQNIQNLRRWVVIEQDIFMPNLRRKQ